MSERLGIAARVVASGWTALFLLLTLGYAFVDDPNQSEDAADLLLDTMLTALFLAAALGACVLSWISPRLSFVLFIATGTAGIAIGAITAGEGRWIAALVSGSPYLLAAVLAWLSTDSRRGEPTNFEEHP